MPAKINPELNIHAFSLPIAPRSLRAFLARENHGLTLIAKIIVIQPTERAITPKYLRARRRLMVLKNIT